MNTSTNRINGTSNRRPAMATTVGLGILAGLAGTVVMTAFQELIEMPLTGRGDNQFLDPVRQTKG